MVPSFQHSFYDMVWRTGQMVRTTPPSLLTQSPARSPSTWQYDFDKRCAVCKIVREKNHRSIRYSLFRSMWKEWPHPKENSLLMPVAFMLWWPRWTIIFWTDESMIQKCNEHDGKNDHCVFIPDSYWFINQTKHITSLLRMMMASNFKLVSSFSNTWG